MATDALDDPPTPGPEPGSPLAQAMARMSGSTGGRPLSPSFKFTWKDYAQALAGKIIILVMGPKSSSKTWVSFNLPGRIFCDSFDMKSKEIADGYYAGDPRLYVVNAVRYYTDSDPSLVQWPLEDGSGRIIEAPLIQLSAVKSVAYVEQGIDLAKENFAPHWIMLDDFETFSEMAEQKMRFNQGLEPVQGIKDGNVWKERTMIMRGLYRRALAAAKCGVIITCYPQEGDTSEKNRYGSRAVKVQEGTGEATQKAPSWFRTILKEADVVIETSREWNGAARKNYFSAHVVSAKPIGGREDILKTGQTFDISDFKPIQFGPGLETFFKRIANEDLPALRAPPPTAAKGSEPEATSSPAGDGGDALD